MTRKTAAVVLLRNGQFVLGCATEGRKGQQVVLSNSRDTPRVFATFAEAEQTVCNINNSNPELAGQDEAERIVRNSMSLHFKPVSKAWAKQLANLRLGKRSKRR